ncbi:hypothetical protein [Mesomycoplasma neurolyticum]|uniref:Uncharacterized protein n=1 Tax=Mesomycoplasma neurolyticum TaxID=2120 RepID=A0A449A5S9_9BACT|nr:hypothetical protein [Mesomycoplasma neurolyticum]VEU59615.1 Uncharacterised protein [Mesomycoplasma neurolyticum]
MQQNKIISFLDVSFKKQFKQISFSLKKGEDLIIYSSDDSIPYAFKELLILKKRNYDGLINIGGQFLEKNNKDFFLNTKVLSIFSKKNKQNYYSELLYDVLKFSFINNNFIFNIFNDFMKDWKEVSFEYGFDIKKGEIENLKNFNLQKISIYKIFLNSFKFKKIQNLSNHSIEDINNYLDFKISFLKKILNLNSIFEINKFENYLKFQKKFRNKEGQIHELKLKAINLKTQIKNFANTSDYNQALHKKNKIIAELLEKQNKIKNILSKGYDNYVFYNFLLKNFKSKIKLAKKELNEEKKNKNQDSIYKAKVNLLVKIKSKKIFQKYKKYYKFIDNNLLHKFYLSLNNFEYKMFNEIFFFFKRKKHLNFKQYNFVYSEQNFKNDRTHIFNIIKYKNEQNAKELTEKLKIISNVLIKNKRVNINNLSKKTNKFQELYLKNEYYKFNADYKWLKEKNEENLQKQIADESSNILILEKELINYMYNSAKIDKNLFVYIKKQFNLITQSEKEKIEAKISTIKKLTQLQSTIYKINDFIYNKHLDEDNIITKIIYKKEMKDLLSKINIPLKKLWEPFDTLTQEEKINIDFAKYNFYEPEITLVDLEKTLFDQKYVDKLLDFKKPNTSLIIFSNKLINTKKINNFLFIEKGKIIESSFNNSSLIFDTRFAKNFVETNELNLNFLYTINDKNYEEIYNGKKNIEIKNSVVYTSENELILLDATYNDKNNLKNTKLTQIIYLDNVPIIDKTKKNKENYEKY